MYRNRHSPARSFTLLSALLSVAACGEREGAEVVSAPVLASEQPGGDRRGSAELESARGPSSGRGEDLARAAALPLGAALRLAAPVAPSEGWRVLVLDELSGEPLPGALVFYVDPGIFDPSLLDEASASGADLFSVIEEYGQARRADAAGELIVPWRPGVGGLVVGRSAGRSGSLELVGEMQDPARLFLGQDHHLSVRVVDREGQPVEGAPVTLRTVTDRGTRDGARVATDSDGLVRLEHSVPEPDGEQSSARLYATLAIIAPDPVQVLIDLDSPAADPIELVMPPTGSVSVTLLDRTGEPRTDEVMVGLWLPLLGAGTRGVPEQHEGSAAYAMCVQGVAHFPYVCLGEALGAHATTLDHSDDARASFMGPSRAGEHVEARLVFTPVKPLLIVRLLDIEGEPLVEEQVACRLEEKSASSSRTSRTTRRTDSNGLLELPVDATAAVPEGSRRTMEFTLSGREPAASARLDLSNGLAPGVNDLGDLILRVPALVVSGMTTEVRGNPLEGVRVTLEREQRYGPEEGQSYWQGVEGMQTTSDAEGRFSLHGEPDPGALRIYAGLEGWVAPEPSAVNRGDTGVLLVLSAAGSIAGSLLLDGGVPEERLEVGVSLDGGGALSDRPHKGSFSWESLDPGTYSFWVSAHGLLEPLVRLEGVQVQAGEQTRDPRLQDIDLRGRLLSIDVRVLGQDGSAIEDSEVSVLDAAGLVRFTTSVWRGETTFLTTPDRPMHLRVAADGYRSVERTGVLEDLEVRMREGIPVRVALAGGNPLSYPYEISVELVPDGGAGLLTSGRHYLDELGEVELRVPAAGDYQARLYVWRTIEGSSTGRGLRLQGVHSIPEAGARVTLEVPLEAIEEARDKL